MQDGQATSKNFEADGATSDAELFTQIHPLAAVSIQKHLFYIINTHERFAI